VTYKTIIKYSKNFVPLFQVKIFILEIKSIEMR
jgi:hypothetical protein